MNLIARTERYAFWTRGTVNRGANLHSQLAYDGHTTNVSCDLFLERKAARTLDQETMTPSQSHNIRTSTPQQRTRKQSRMKIGSLLSWSCLLCMSQQTSVFAFQTSTNSGRVLALSKSGTALQAFGLPDEVPPAKEDTTSEDTLKSLTEKLEKSKEAAEMPKKTENKAMAFLRKQGRIGGAANKNFVNAVGSDEGSTGRQPPVERDDMGNIKKSKQNYQECSVTGVIDDMSEAFPLTSSGTEWRGVSDRVMGGISNGIIKREMDLEGRTANVLMGHVSLANNGGFIQMVTDLPLDASKDSVDASEYDGLQLEVLCRNVHKDDEDNEPPSKNPQTFNVHLRTPGTFQQASYRHTFEIAEPNEWTTIMIPWTSFLGYGVSEPLDISALRRIGIVAIGKEMDVFLAVGGVNFYSVF